jgi:hypothetical protein
MNPTQDDVLEPYSFVVFNQPTGVITKEKEKATLISFPHSQP